MGKAEALSWSKKGDEVYIKRPDNAFILFRRKCLEDRQQQDGIADTPIEKQRHADLSKTISWQWKSLSAEERQHWEQLAKEKKNEHEKMYPNYVYQPQRAKDTSSSSPAYISYSASPSLQPSPTSSHNNSSSTAKKKHTCPTCDRSFTTSGHLARHFRVHTGGNSLTNVYS